MNRKKRERRERALDRRRRDAERWGVELDRAIRDGHPGRVRTLTRKRDLARAEVKELS